MSADLCEHALDQGGLAWGCHSAHSRGSTPLTVSPTGQKVKLLTRETIENRLLACNVFQLMVAGTSRKQFLFKVKPFDQFSAS